MNLLNMKGLTGDNVLDELVTNASTAHQKQSYILHFICLSVFFASSLYEFSVVSTVWCSLSSLRGRVLGFWAV